MCCRICRKCPVPYRAQCRAVVVWLAICVLLAWVVLDPLLLHGALPSIRNSHAVSKTIVLQEFCLRALHTTELNQVADTAAASAEVQAATVPLSVLVFTAAENISEPHIALSVHEFGEQGSKSALCAPAPSLSSLCRQQALMI